MPKEPEDIAEKQRSLERIFNQKAKTEAEASGKYDTQNKYYDTDLQYMFETLLQNAARFCEYHTTDILFLMEELERYLLHQSNDIVYMAIAVRKSGVDDTNFMYDRCRNAVKAGQYAANIYRRIYIIRIERTPESAALVMKDVTDGITNSDFAV